MDLISADPYWRIKNGLINHYPTLHTSLACDVLIVGGGISAALISHALTKVGLKVVVIEKQNIANGSSSGSTALLQYEIDSLLVELKRSLGDAVAEAAYQASYQSIDELEKICRDTGYSMLQRKESYYFASNEKDAEVLETEWKARRNLGFDVRLITKKEIENLFSFSRPAALYSTQAAQLDPYLFTHHLFQWGIANGLQVYDHSPLVEFSTHDGIVTAKVGSHLITSKHLVFATGYESVRFLPSTYVSLHSSYAVISKPTNGFKGWHNEALLWETARPYLYLRTTSDGRALVGGLDEAFYNPEKRDKLIETKAQQLTEKFKELFPAIHFDLAFAWAGTFAETNDGLPIIGTAKQSNIHYSCGFGGNGITYSVVASDIIKDKILNKPNPFAKIFELGRGS